MKKVVIIFAVALLLSGCATYRFQHGTPPYDKGYVVSRDDYVILEYTIGKDNTVPPIALAKERFKERRKIVEHYYKKMGYVENHFKMAFWDPPVMLLKLIGGTFRIPFIAVSDYRAAHNPKYKERIRKIEDEKDAREEARIQRLKDELNAYIKNTLPKESMSLIQQPTTGEPVAEQPPTEQILARQPAIEEAPVGQLTPEEPVAEQPTKEESATEPPIQEEPFVEQPLAETEIKIEKGPPVEEPELIKVASAVIIAKPQKGYSPLKVRFDGRKSHSAQGKIVSYYWEFGDGDTSTKPNPVNIYWSTTYGSINFTATLTVKDDKGNTSTASTNIEVMTK